ncbi:hypothetical protein CQ13_23025 [Bradyrhizobium retamae]|uniref:Tripartite tricarboxylate transporter substrate binding protein n=1 Tax=Bradyrhizobium retamae TaxID=1300035 RepID=A0A0R3NA52_9BRAD|nr:hypothetical protein CQ13_23025 [Bradyrhizobium retamae]
MSFLVSRLTIVVVALLCAVAAQAQDYPKRPITMIVPFAAGGTSDVIARVVAEEMTKSLGQPIVRSCDKKAPPSGAFCYRPVVEPGPVGDRVEPLGEGLMWVFPDGFAGLFRPAAALPASLLMPVVELPPVPLPAVVPLVEDPAAPPVPELPPAPLPPACAKAKVFVNASATANPIVASFMIAPFLAA